MVPRCFAILVNTSWGLITETYGLDIVFLPGNLGFSSDSEYKLCCFMKLIFICLTKGLLGR